MKRGLISVAALAIAGCAAEGLNLDDPAVQRLFTMSTPQYYATQAIANQVAQGCSRFTYDTGLDAQLNEARNEVGRGSLGANSQRDAIDLETDVSRRSFQAKHDIEFGTDDLCAAADAEILEGSALSAFLVPA
ncbi:MAG: hypothetical protein AAGF56_10175 [Pseudomonadota bacterium]